MYRHIQAFKRHAATDGLRRFDAAGLDQSAVSSSPKQHRQSAAGQLHGEVIPMKVAKRP
jgi:hypothetical protein